MGKKDRRKNLIVYNQAALPSLPGIPEIAWHSRDSLNNSYFANDFQSLSTFRLCFLYLCGSILGKLKARSYKNFNNQMQQSQF